MVLITNCRIDIARGVGFNYMTLITNKSGCNSIDARHGLRLGNKSTACSSNIGTVFTTKGGIDAKSSVRLYGAQLITYADNKRNEDQSLTTFVGGSVEMMGSSIFSGANMRFNKSVKFTDCPFPTSRGIVKNDYIRMGVY